MRRIFLPLMAPALIGVGVWSLLNASRIMGIPVLLYEGTRNQVLAVLMWNMWEQGQLQVVAALGTAMTIVLLGITLALRFFGFGKGMDRN
jgi:iron(III) transport system permease protein